MFLFSKAFLTLALVVFSALISGCALVGLGVGYGISESATDDLTGIVEIGEVKTKLGANVTVLKTAKLSSVVFEKNMTAPNASPRPSDIKVNTTVADEVKRSLGIPGNDMSPMTVRIKTYFGEVSPWGWSIRDYWNITEKKTLGYAQQMGVRKIVNTHFVLEQGSDTLLEVHGLWVGNDKADEIDGARQLAKEMASAVLKKLNSPAPRSAATEAKKD